jgi:hypothetical protein
MNEKLAASHDQAAYRHSQSCRPPKSDRLEPVVLHIVTCQARLIAGPDRPRPLIRLSKNSGRLADRPGTTLVHREPSKSNPDSPAVNALSPEFFHRFYSFRTATGRTRKAGRLQCS